MCSMKVVGSSLVFARSVVRFRSVMLGSRCINTNTNTSTNGDSGRVDANRPRALSKLYGSKLQNQQFSPKLGFSKLYDRGRTPRTNNPALEYQTADSKHDTTGAREFEILEEVPTMVCHGKSSYAFADLPKAVVMTVDQGSMVTCLEFHPQQLHILLVGTNSGEIAIWDLNSRDKLVHKDFKVSDLGACSESLQVLHRRKMLSKYTHIMVVMI